MATPAILQLRTIPCPGDSLQAEVFASDASARRHLLNHVLLERECFAWQLILPAWEHLLGEESSGERNNYRHQVEHTGGVHGQDLYDALVSAIADDASDSAVLGWMAQQGQLRVCFGSRAILMIFEEENNQPGQPPRVILRTAFLPGLGDPGEVVRARRENRPRQAVRQTANRRRRSLRGSYRDHDHPREQRKLKGREATWTWAERFFWRVFRPAYRFLRNQHGTYRQLDGQHLPSHYHLVFPCLPNVRHMQPRDWQDIRKSCNRPEDAP